MCIDIVVTHAAVANPEHLAANARHQGTAAKAAEARKYTKYYNCKVLYPFAIETGGRLGEVAKAVIKRLAPTRPADRTQAINDLHAQISHAVQLHNALMIMHRENPPHPRLTKT